MVYLPLKSQTSGEDSVSGTKQCDANIKFLLDSMSNINRQEKEIQQVTGEAFNIFEIVRIGHYEVGTHSPMLAEILDPRGRHGQGSKFLELFLHAIRSRRETRKDGADLSSLSSDLLPDPSSATVFQERSLGGLGRVDIFIRDNTGRTLIIENKIYAADQEGQIFRYLSYKPSAVVVYLTLSGDTPSDYSLEQSLADNKDFTARLILFSYRDDLLEWLEDCRKVVPTVTRVHESLTQYIQLIKRLTGHNLNQRMNNAIISTVTESPDTLEAFFNLHQSYDDVRNSLVNSLQEKVKLKLKVDIEMHPMELGNTKENGIYFSSQLLEQKNLYICLYFEQSDFRACCFGIVKKDGESLFPCSEELKAAVNEAMPEMTKSSKWWPVYDYWRHSSWTIETWKGIIDENGTVPTQLAEDVNLLHETLKAFYAE